MSFDPMPPRPGRNHEPGRYKGMAEFLRSLQVGENKPCPRKWENSLHGAAERIGISIVTRRLGATDTTMVWRVS